MLAFHKCRKREYVVGTGCLFWSKRDSSTARPGASRKTKGTGRFAQNDGRGNANISLGSRCGGPRDAFDFANHFVNSEDLREQVAECGASGFLKLRSGKAAHRCCGRSITQENHAKIANGGLAGAGFAADVGGDAADDDRIDAALAKNQLQIGAMKRTKAGLVEKDVARINDEIFVQRR